MSEKQKETTIFDSRLREDEYIIWWGKTTDSINIAKPKRLMGCGWYMLAQFVLVAPIFAGIVAIMFLIHGIINSNWESIIDGIVLAVVSPFLFIFLLSESKKEEYELLNTANQYVITNQRVLLYEDGNFQETSLILMQDAVKTKPRNGQSDINLYDRRSPTGQLPAPIATLNNLSEEDAETAYDLLVKARDLSFEERIEDMGLE